MRAVLRLLGLFDLATGCLLGGYEAGLVPLWFFIPFGLGLVMKGALFRQRIIGAADLFAGMYIFFLPLFGTTVMSGGVAVYLVQKGVASFISVKSRRRKR